MKKVTVTTYPNTSFPVADCKKTLRASDVVHQEKCVGLVEGLFRDAVKPLKDKQQQTNVIRLQAAQWFDNFYPVSSKCTHIITFLWDVLLFSFYWLTSVHEWEPVLDCRLTLVYITNDTTSWLQTGLRETSPVFGAHCQHMFRTIAAGDISYSKHLWLFPAHCLEPRMLRSHGVTKRKPPDRQSASM